jgi:diguanylate cyclase (GGDEF)-like protein
VTTLVVAVKDRKVVFLDIDELKEFNTAHAEPVVGRNLLPRFTLALEAHVHHHGDAYRQGGDEYRVLLPSESRPLAVAFLAELRAKVAALKYPEIDGATTVSIGRCILDPDCPLTERELPGW